MPVSIVTILTGLNDDMEIMQYNESPSKQLSLHNHTVKLTVLVRECRHYAVQGHSRSPILVPVESTYTTSY